MPPRLGSTTWALTENDCVSPMLLHHVISASGHARKHARGLWRVPLRVEDPPSVFIFKEYKTFNNFIVGTFRLLTTMRFFRRGDTTPLRGRWAMLSTQERCLNPHPAIPPYVVRTSHCMEHRLRELYIQTVYRTDSMIRYTIICL